ncbi:aminodeoxychorismate lyase [Acerihabitans sp. TG2]|uniref:aminodeoxychorismate lyase n=1 Tax=Acerihabitans sp. TG2 TaxID=3096008 RepID=UPI002B238782|nr:aminodeoxychorismate lyase [Acerihabitans sp. TG2]MEA9391990.1 aminodeoxychorismate lyase [Acerihabitans sp. TG2]
MFWINGQPQQHLPLDDRAIQFGDGFFTTARINQGRIEHLPYHMERLIDTAKLLLFTTVDWSSLIQEMLRFAELQQEGALKVIISRGSGGRGYSPAGCTEPVRILSHRPIPAEYATWRDEGVMLAKSPVRLGRSSMLAGVKHLNRLEQVMIRAYLDRQTEAQEALVLDDECNVIECCAANIFWRTGDDVFTPDLRFAGVAGIMRNHILHLLRGSPFDVHMGEAFMYQIKEADEVIICNALMPVLPVNRIDEQCYTGARTLFDFISPNC